MERMIDTRGSWSNGALGLDDLGSCDGAALEGVVALYV